jgi:hypothetical protein
MSSFRRTTTTTTSSTFGRPRTVTTTTTTTHRDHSAMTGDELVAYLIVGFARGIVEAFAKDRLTAAQRKELAVAARSHARNCQNCALGSKDGKQGPSSAQNQTDMIEKALRLAQEAHDLDASVVTAAHVRGLRELAQSVARNNISRTTPSTCFRHTAIG